ncbi:MAG: cation-translocating P-type ATPase [Anaerolineae bacterium]|nr:cation-translocating P-type ATPase [Anaerolineae bacterium]
MIEDLWYQNDVEEVLKKLESGRENGLTSGEAEERLAKYGSNELVDKGGKSPWKILLDQLTGVMVIILIISAVISIFLGDVEDAIAILAIVILNTILGFTQEYRAEKAMEALKKMAVPHVRVRRDGRVLEVSARDVVPGDIVLVEAGNTIPADGRLMESSNLRIQEAVLTGESEPVEKIIEAIPQSNLGIGDRRNSVYSGTIVTYGRGAYVVTETGMQTQLGHIANMLQSVGQESTPLQNRLEQVGRGLAMAALAIVAVVFAMGVMRGDELRLLFLTAISLAVAAVPEGLPTVVTIALSVGAQRMLKRHALIRKLPAVETLGSVTVICSDKTGTLTENRMTVTVLDTAGSEINLQEQLRDFSPTVNPENDPVLNINEKDSIRLLLAGGALCNDATLEPSQTSAGEYSAIGDPTEGALVIAAAHGGLWKAQLEQTLPRVAELPFDSERKRMTTVHPFVATDNALALLKSAGASARFIAFTKGSVDGLLDISTHVWTDHHMETLDDAWRKRIQDANNRLAGNGMRVLGLAYQLRDNEKTNDTSAPLEQNLTFVGLVGMIDPARAEVKDAVFTAKTAGIRPVMITGDHPLTAAYIARELGIMETGHNDKTLTGQDLEKMSTEDLEKVVDDVAVYARVSPEHKLKIVQALQRKGHIVAMTGDGVNDAPALKKADIGVAMGITGTDVSKEAADMVLLDDNFATIVAAVEEGRRIYDNIRKFIKYALTSNSGEIWVMLAAPLLGMPLPLLPLQILWINLVTDGLPGLAMTMEAAESDTMKRPPYNPKENIFARGMGRDIIWIGLLLGAVSLGMGYWAWSIGDPGWQTMIFTTVTLSQMGNALALRSEKESLFKIGLFSNKLLLGSVILTIALQLAVIYVPFLQEIFNTQALSLTDLAISPGLSLVVFAAVEAFKWILRMTQK